jgi:hypothetical protein
MGLEDAGLLFSVNAEKPVSSPLTTCWAPATDPFGSTSGPKVRCRTSELFAGDTPLT